MKLTKWMQIILVCSALVTLVACSSAHKNRDQSAINEANAAYDGSAQTAGLGEDGSLDGASNQRSASNRVYHFDYDSNVVHDDDKPAIEANAEYLASHPKAKILLEGHTDPRGSREYNIGLGERRAKAVAEILTASGVNLSQIRIVSYGAEKLASSGRTEADFAQDRRVVLAYMQR